MQRGEDEPDAAVRVGAGDEERQAEAEPVQDPDLQAEEEGEPDRPEPVLATNRLFNSLLFLSRRLPNRAGAPGAPPQPFP